MTEPTPERLDDNSDLERGLTQAQILELFGDQGEFADEWQAYKVLSRKATLAAEWLSSFWTGPIPDWLLDEQEEARVEWQNKIDEATDDNPEFPGEKTWLQSMVGAWEEEQGITNPSPLHHIVHHYFGDVRQKGREEEYDQAQEIVVKLFVDAETGASTQTKQQLKYAKKVLELQGEESLNSAFSRGFYTPDVTFPKPLMGFANYSNQNTETLF